MGTQVHTSVHVLSKRPVTLQASPRSLLPSPPSFVNPYCLLSAFNSWTKTCRMWRFTACLVAEISLSFLFPVSLKRERSRPFSRTRKKSVSSLTQIMISCEFECPASTGRKRLTARRNKWTDQRSKHPLQRLLSQRSCEGRKSPTSYPDTHGLTNRKSPSVVMGGGVHTPGTSPRRLHYRRLLHILQWPDTLGLKYHGNGFFPTQVLELERVPPTTRRYAEAEPTAERTSVLKRIRRHRSSAEKKRRRKRS